MLPWQRHNQGTRRHRLPYFHLPVGADDDLLGTIQEPVVPPAVLLLKVGCITSIMRNLSIEDTLVMNARQVVVLRPIVVQIRLLQQGAIRRRVWPTCRLSTFFFPRISFEFQSPGANWTVQRRQFPLRLAYAPRSTAARASPWIAWCST
jgi:hypothetical protein